MTAVDSSLAAAQPAVGKPRSGVFRGLLSSWKSGGRKHTPQGAGDARGAAPGAARREDADAADEGEAWDALPHEVISLIVQHATARSSPRVRRVLRLVNRSWKAAVDERIRGATLDRESARANVVSLHQQVAKRDDLDPNDKRTLATEYSRKFALRSGTLNALSLQSLAFCAPTLTTLRVTCTIGGVAPDAMARCTSLKRLRLKLAWGIKESAKRMFSIGAEMRTRSALIRAISELPCLESLDLSESSGVMLAGYWRRMAAAPRLRTLLLDGVRVPESVIKQICSITTLRELSIPYADCDQAGEGRPTFVADIAAKLPNLEALNLMWLGSTEGFCNSKLKEYMHVRDLRALTGLRTLAIGSCDHLTDTHFQYLSALERLESLSLAHNGWGPWPTSGVFFQFLQGANMRSVHLHDFSYFDDRGMILLCMHCPALEDLYIDSASRITMRGFNCLREMPALRRLVLVGLNLDAAVTGPVLEDMPSMELKSHASVAPRVRPAEFETKFVENAR